MGVLCWQKDILSCWQAVILIWELLLTQCKNAQCIILALYHYLILILAYCVDKKIHENFDLNFWQCMVPFIMDIKIFLVKSFFIWDLWLTQCKNTHSVLLLALYPLSNTIQNNPTSSNWKREKRVCMQFWLMLLTKFYCCVLVIRQVMIAAAFAKQNEKYGRARKSHLPTKEKGNSYTRCTKGKKKGYTETK